MPRETVPCDDAALVDRVLGLVAQRLAAAGR